MKKTIGYGRLSRDDGDDESTSIFNQKRIIEEFAKQHGLEIDEFYIDDGFRSDDCNILNFGNFVKTILKGIKIERKSGYSSSFFVDFTDCAYIMPRIANFSISYTENRKYVFYKDDEGRHLGFVNRGKGINIYELFDQLTDKKMDITYPLPRITEEERRAYVRFGE